MRIAPLLSPVVALMLTSPVMAEPVPVGPPNAPDQTPAFEGQTRAPQLEGTVRLDTQTVADGLEHPWGMAFLPDGNMLVTERPGRLRLITPEGDISEPIKGLPEVDARGQGGLLDVSLGPDFDTERWVYLSYAEPRGNAENATAVARGRLNEDSTRLTDVETIFQQQPAWASTKHFGSRLVWGTNGMLWITVGERSLVEPRQLAQTLDNTIGKVVRINADGSMPDDNPFVGRDEARDDIWSLGHRNVQGAARHPQTGELWTIEHGPKGGDELNRPEPGLNYGWPVITYGEDYSGAPIGQGITQQDGMEQPVYYWDPVIAPGDMTFYTGDRFDGWQNNILIASLEPGGIVRLTLEEGRVTGEARYLEELGRVRDVDQGPDGALWVLTDKGDGALIRVVPKE
ncbi:Glucose/arabinose dehydrogenase, beta-propeller fold [Kushneria avicenniae]|uniref:Glucose/arabinose dehydrogenase, beta-propeller fold n=1 Tax=Kushneria avicenniae TaxID=402385 RepID=A0A1I1JGY5_9GAMM|nr:PQQ-dependent sugar dehydrogenase [Kushneria avicenniae]SFC47777.1 Glucose/arabinose dehydrogenase, beta-propeller fold [Kushneria avicenniae]